MTTRILPISGMAARHPALKSPIAEFYQTAACVCLDRHHIPPTPFALALRDNRETVEVSWAPQDDATRGAWANEIDTTEAGAYACVIAAVELLTGMVAVRRAEGGTGADFYIGPPGSGAEDLEDCLRLEVSGLDKGTPDQIARRLEQKIGQATRGSSNLPAFAGVVGFRYKEILIAPVEDAA